MKKVIIIIVVLAMAFCMIAAGYPEKESNEGFEEIVNEFIADFLEDTDGRGIVKREGNRVSFSFDTTMTGVYDDGLGIATIVFDGDANTMSICEIGFNIDGENFVAIEVYKISEWSSTNPDGRIIFKLGEIR